MSQLPSSPKNPDPFKNSEQICGSAFTSETSPTIIPVKSYFNRKN